MLARRDLLAMWEDEAFEWEFVSAKLLRRRVFLCNSPESVQFAFSTKNASFERKSPEMRNVLEPLIGDGLFVSDGNVWRTRRRIVGPIVHISRLPKFAPIMVEAALEFRDRFSRPEQPVVIDALREMAQLTAEIICRTLFGRELGRSYSQEVVGGFSEYQRAVSTIDFVSLLGLPSGLPRLLRPSIGRSVRRIIDVLDRILEDYRGGVRGDGVSVIGHLFDARDEETGQPLDREALRNEAAVLFMAGHETTANSLAWTWYLLSQAPEVEARLHAEVDSVLNGRPPTLEDVPRLIYTRAVFEEALRLYPPVPLLSREAVRAESFQDTDIPKGSLILVVPWLLHRHRKLWEKPDHFLPERFLPGYHRPPSKFSYVPFSIGPRVCPGMGFGLTEAVLCIATLAQVFQIRLAPNHRVQPVCRMTLRPGDTLPMTLHARSARSGAPVAAEIGNVIAKCPVHHLGTG
jgi:cytochrome P450